MATTKARATAELAPTAKARPTAKLAPPTMVAPWARKEKSDLEKVDFEKKVATPHHLRAIPAVPPNWPWYKNKPVTYVYRAMRLDMDDLKPAVHGRLHEAQLLFRRTNGQMTDEGRKHVLRAVLKGSKERSPFLHTSTSVASTNSWHCLARQDRHEQQSVMCKIDIWGAYCAGVLKEEMVIDLSDRNAWLRFMLANPGRLDDFSPNCDWTVPFDRATKAREVLLMWRGEIPLEFFQIIDNYDARYEGANGESLGFLQHFIDLAKSPTEYDYDVMKQRAEHLKAAPLVPAPSVPAPGSVIDTVLLNSPASQTMSGSTVLKTVEDSNESMDTNESSKRISPAANALHAVLQSSSRPTPPKAIFPPRTLSAVEISKIEPTVTSCDRDELLGFNGRAAKVSRASKGSMVESSNAATSSGSEPIVTKKANIELGLIDPNKDPMRKPPDRACEIANVESPAGFQPAALSQAAAPAVSQPSHGAQTTATPIKEDMTPTVQDTMKRMKPSFGDFLESDDSDTESEYLDESPVLAANERGCLEEKSSCASDDKHMKQDAQLETAMKEQSRGLEQTRRLDEKEQSRLLNSVVAAGQEKKDAFNAKMPAKTCESVKAVHDAEEEYSSKMANATTKYKRTVRCMLHIAA